jgi:hypothetical protein
MSAANQTQKAPSKQTAKQFSRRAGSGALCDWHVTAEHRCKDPASHEMHDEEWAEWVPVCAEHAAIAGRDGFQIRKLQNDQDVPQGGGKAS